MRRSGALIIVCVALVAAVAAPARIGFAQGADFARQKQQGMSYYELGNYRLAATFLEKASQLNPRDGETLYYLGLTYKSMGNSKLATQYMERARSVGYAVPETDEPPTSEPRPIRGSSAIAAPPPGNLGRVREKWALIVGVSRFQDPGIKGLVYTAKDANDFATVLADPQAGRFKRDHILVLTDEKATTKGIKVALDDIAGKALRDDLVVIYLSSHGSPASADIAGEGYFITYDTEISSLYATALKMGEFADDVKKRLKAERKVVFLDTCYSAQAGAEGARAIRLPSAGQENMAQQLSGYGFVVITSSSRNEQSWESKRIQNGYFTNVLIEALREKGGLLPIEKIFSRLQDEVPRRVSHDVKQSQNPRMFGNAPEIRIGVDTDQ